MLPDPSDPLPEPCSDRAVDRPKAVAGPALPARPAHAARRRFLAGAAAVPLAAALGAMAGCASPLPWLPPQPQGPAGPRAARQAALRVLEASAEAHGRAAAARLHDVNVRYAGAWRALIGRIQPGLVDAPHRQGSEERLLLGARVIAQAHRGPGGGKQVLRRPGPAGSADQGEVRVWFDGAPSDDEDVTTAAALVADGYRWFLLGPLALAPRDPAAPWPEGAMSLGEPEAVDGRVCDVVRLDLTPGWGYTPLDRLALWIDRDQRLMRRLRFSLDGYGPTQGAIAEVDTYEHVTRHGVVWPTRWHERLVRPIPGLPVHDWRLEGLDVDRGYALDAIEGPAFTGAAARPAAALG